MPLVTSMQELQASRRGNQWHPRVQYPVQSIQRYVTEFMANEQAWELVASSRVPNYVQNRTPCVAKDLEWLVAKGGWLLERKEYRALPRILNGLTVGC
jgi:hypothetical protein